LATLPKKVVKCGAQVPHVGSLSSVHSTVVPLKTPSAPAVDVQADPANEIDWSFERLSGSSVPVMVKTLVASTYVKAVISPTAGIWVNEQSMLWQTAGISSISTSIYGFSS